MTAKKNRTLNEVVLSWQAILKDKQLALASATLGLFIVLHLPLVKSTVGEWALFKWFDLNILIPIVLTLLLFQSAEITARLIAVEGGIQTVRTDIYTVVRNAVTQVEKKQHKKLDVLGLSLRDGWNWTRGWIEGGDLDGWTVNLSAYLPSDEPERWSPRSWPETSKRNLDEIAAFKSSDRAARSKVRLNSYSYPHTPPIHGYRIGNGDIYMAYVGWTPRGKVTGLNPRYEFIPNTDKSPRAKAKRAFFQSWLNAAQKNPVGSTDSNDASPNSDAGSSVKRGDSQPVGSERAVVASDAE